MYGPILVKAVGPFVYEGFYVRGFLLGDLRPGGLGSFSIRHTPSNDAEIGFRNRPGYRLVTALLWR